MRKLIAVGAPAFAVRLLRRSWAVIGDPRDTVGTPTGFLEGVDPVVQYVGP